MRYWSNHSFDILIQLMPLMIAAMGGCPSPFADSAHGSSGFQGMHGWQQYIVLVDNTTIVQQGLGNVINACSCRAFARSLGMTPRYYIMFMCKLSHFSLVSVSVTEVGSGRAWMLCLRTPVDCLINRQDAVG